MPLDDPSSAARDVVVVGGGPAGASTAIALARLGLSVTLFERTPEPRQRVGETLPPSIRGTLERLGVWERFAAGGHDAAIGNRSYWGSDEPSEVHFVASPYGSGWHIDRRRFERMLLDAAAGAGVTIRAGTSGEDAQARFVVDATGRASSVARLRGVARVSIDQLVGVTMFVDAATTERFTLIEARENGWWYSALLPDERMVVAFMTDADLATAARLRDRDAWLRELSATRATRARIKPVIPAGQPAIAAANTSRLTSIVGRGWFAVGDAAVSFDPLSSQGITTAMECALSAATAIARSLDGDRDALFSYAAEVTAIYRRYLVDRARYYGAERRWPSAPFWSRRQVGVASGQLT